MTKNKMWGGRYDSGPSAIMERINASIDFDRRLYAQDIAGSKAHCRMLVDQGIVSVEDGAAIQDGLDRMNANDREVLVMRHFEELSNAETAHELGIESSAASKRYLRALQRLRKILEEPDADGLDA